MTRSAARIVSLVPSVTETLVTWGVTPIAVTRFCEQPGLLTVGGTKNPDVPAIVALQPDVVVVDKEENRSEDADALRGEGVPLLVLHVRSVADVGPEMGRLAEAAGVPAPGPPRIPADADSTAPPVRAWVPIWRRPWMTIGPGTYGSSVLDVTGFANVVSEQSGPYPEMALEAARALRPDVVLAPSEPYPFAERHRAELEQVAPVQLVDGKDLFWWGSRTSSALQRLRRLASKLAP